MNDFVTTVQLHTPPIAQADMSATGAWQESGRQHSDRFAHFRSLGQVAGLALALFASPASVQDLRYIESQRSGARTMQLFAQHKIGRPISRSEALTIARRVREQAEQERLVLVRWEAERGINWNEA